MKMVSNRVTKLFCVIGLRRELKIKLHDVSKKKRLSFTNIFLASITLYSGSQHDKFV
jgi:hypothetical protein